VVVREIKDVASELGPLRGGDQVPGGFRAALSDKECLIRSAARESGGFANWHNFAESAGLEAGAVVTGLEANVVEGVGLQVDERAAVLALAGVVDERVALAPVRGAGDAVAHAAAGGSRSTVVVEAEAFEGGLGPGLGGGAEGNGDVNSH